jgi:hypothetical protein
MNPEFNIDDARELILSAQEHLQEAIAALNEYCGMSGDKNTEAYLLAPLKIRASAQHGFLSRDKNLDDVLAELDAREQADAPDGPIIDDERKAFGY